MPPDILPARRRLTACLLLACFLLLAGCSSVRTFGAFLRGEVVVTEAELQQRLDRRFPRDYEVGGGLGALTLERPQAALQDDRLQLAFDVQASAVGLRLPLRGHFAFTSALRFDADAQALYLQDPQLVRLDLPRLPGLPSDQDLFALGEVLLAQYAHSEPVYVLSERRQAQVPRGRSIYRVDIEDGRIVIGVRR